MTGDIEHSKNIYGAECTRKTARAEYKKGGGGRALGRRSLKKMDVAGLEVDVLREARRRGLRDYLQKKVVHGTGHGECR